MRLAILSDIHGNFEALESVVYDARMKGYDRMVCLGDVVGYGADPAQCVELIREKVWKDAQGEVVVKGNHDEAASGGDDSQFNPDAQRAIRWTKAQLSDRQIEWLANLPYVRAFTSYLLVHASPSKPEAWTYVTTMIDAVEAFDHFEQRVAFVGHTHVPFHAFTDGAGSSIQVETGEFMQMREGFRYLTNVGSVGQPRDGDNRASYVIFDTEAGTIERIRVEYPVQTAADKITNAGLPEFLATRLLRGR